MVKIPDSVRPYWDFVAKYPFWLLAPLVPALVLPTLFMTNGKLSAEMASKRTAIDGKISALKQVDGISPHPNDTWSSDMEKRAARVKRETYGEWQRFWESQSSLQTWPAELGADFLQRLGSLRPGRELPRPMLERYQSTVRDLARKLPTRMGADVEMIDPDIAAAEGGAPGQPGAQFGGPGGPPGGPGMMMGRMMQGAGGPGGAMRRSNAVVEWNAADQQRVYDSFHWDKPPKTKQVTLAQEELRVYGLMCDQVAAINQGAGGTYNAAIPYVDQLAVGYLAAEDDPAVSTAGRMTVPGAEAAGGQMGMGMGMRMSAPPGGGPDGGGMPGAGADGAAATIKPMHPRFMPKEGEGGMMGGRMGMSMPPMGGAGGETGAPAAPEGPGTTDEAFLTWIYVDADGKPLKGEEVATSPAALMTHLMPFVIRATIDQRKLDAFLVQLATASVPIDIRQVRINPPAAPAGAAGGMMGGMMGRPPGGGPPGGPPGMGGGVPNRGMMMQPPGGGGPGAMVGGGAAGAGGLMRPHDIVLEIRGTIALATQPDPTALGLEVEGADATPDAAEPEPVVDEAAPAPPADGAPADTENQPAANAPAGDAALPPASEGQEPGGAAVTEPAPAPAEPAPAPENTPAGDAAPAGGTAPPAEPA